MKRFTSKKLAALTMSLVLAMSLIACGGKKEETAAGNAPVEASTQAEEKEEDFVSIDEAVPAAAEPVEEEIVEEPEKERFVLPEGMMWASYASPIKLKDEGTVTVLDTGWDDELSFEKYGDLLEIADYYTPNQKEALKITGCSNAENAAYALRKYFKNVVVKVDKDGCLGIDENGLFFKKSIDEFVNVDSTGAGDAFLAGFCYGLYYDYPLRDCVAFGNVTGGKAVTKAGALSGYVTEKELLEYKNKYDEV